MRKRLPVIWDREARQSLKEIYNYIKKDSPPNARSVRKELLKLAGSLGNFPEKYPREPFLEDEMENFRSVVKWSWKIIYEVTDDAIIILMIFHTSQHPDKIKRRLK